MSQGFDFTGYASKFEQASLSLLARTRGSADIAGKMHLLTTAVERDLDRFSNRHKQDRVACRPGCSSCCILNVSVLFPEAIAITWFLRRRLDAEARVTLLERLTELYHRTGWLDDEERACVREPCAFLDADGCCLIHKVRPLLCRSITSTDPVSCKDGLAMVALEGMPVIDMNLFQKNLMDAAFRGLAEALGDLGLDDRSWRLTTAVRRLFSEAGAVENFLSGQKPSRH